jgi:hypothetical protein
MLNTQATYLRILLVCHFASYAAIGR